MDLAWGRVGAGMIVLRMLLIFLSNSFAISVNINCG